MNAIRCLVSGASGASGYAGGRPVSLARRHQVRCLVRSAGVGRTAALRRHPVRPGRTAGAGRDPQPRGRDVVTPTYTSRPRVVHGPTVIGRASGSSPAVLTFWHDEFFVAPWLKTTEVRKPR